MQRFPRVTCVVSASAKLCGVWPAMNPRAPQSKKAGSRAERGRVEDALLATSIFGRSRIAADRTEYMRNYTHGWRDAYVVALHSCRHLDVARNCIFLARTRMRWVAPDLSAAPSSSTCRQHGCRYHTSFDRSERSYSKKHVCERRPPQGAAAPNKASALIAVPRIRCGVWLHPVFPRLLGRRGAGVGSELGCQSE